MSVLNTYRVALHDFQLKKLRSYLIAASTKVLILGITASPLKKEILRDVPPPVDLLFSDWPAQWRLAGDWTRGRPGTRRHADMPRHVYGQVPRCRSIRPNWTLKPDVRFFTHLAEISQRVVQRGRKSRCQITAETL